ncbi:MAG: EAL domain-containing protein [Hungatella sp.]|nr:EAL domain-containing protein [Hungatella sp.]
MGKAVIYVAGNPDSYPVEYYDAREGIYKGMIPRLFQEFSEGWDYDIRYYEPGEEDLREPLARDRQVDIISGCAGEESFRHSPQGEVLVLDTRTGESEISYRILVTDAAPGQLKADLEEFLSGVSGESMAGMLIDCSKERPALYRRRTRLAFGGLGVVILGLAAGAVWLAGRCRKYRRAADKRDETDSLTGIGNREYLSHYYQQFVIRENRALYAMVYFHVDTDRMRRTGTSERTDGFLRHMASVLLNHTGDRDILARVSDQGFVMARMCPGDEELGQWVTSILNRVRSSWGEQGRYVSSGVCRLKDGDWDLDELLLNVSQAAQDACREDLDYKVCTDSWIRQFEEDRKLQEDMKRGVENQEFQLYVQFYTDGATGRIAGGEALARWGHPEKGILLPGSFIPLMERAGLMGQLDLYSLDQACGFLERLHQVGMEDFFMSCNFSLETLKEDDFMDQCREIVDTYRFDRSRLIFQVPQQALREELPVVTGHIRQMKDMGIQVALDDFGEEFAAFAEVEKYMPDVLQLDKRLVDLLGTNAGNAIVRAMVQVGHQLGIAVMAEGAQREEQAGLLRDMGCDMIQGFCFYRPIPAWEAARKLLEQSADAGKGGL